MNDGLIHNATLTVGNTDDPLTLPSTRAGELMLRIIIFFQQTCSTTNLVYDTYLLYYSGPTDKEGNWICEDGTRIRLSDILHFWKNCLVKHGARPTDARLLLMLDGEFSYVWANQLPNIQTFNCVAIQTAIYKRPRRFFQFLPLQQGREYSTFGTFTDQYIQLNLHANFPHIRATQDFKFVYKVTWEWLRFSFRKPSLNELERFWDTRFCACCLPVKSLLRLFFQPIDPQPTSKQERTSFQNRWIVFILQPVRFTWQVLNTVILILQLSFKRLARFYLEPKYLETGHGFFLIRD